MPAIPVDPARSNFVLAAETIEEVAEYSEADASGNRSKTGNQARDKESGLPLFVIYVLDVPEPGARPEIAKVKVASLVPPVLGPALVTTVRLSDLVAVPYIAPGGRNVAISYKCTGVDVVVAPGARKDAA